MIVKRFAEKMGKQISRIDKNTIERCQNYPWPGNIRELQNIVERSVILCGGSTFSIDQAWLAKAVLFLASEDSSYVNAIELMVDGGLTGASFGAPILRG